MKRLWISLGILVLIAAFCVYATVRFVETDDAVRTKLENVLNAADIEAARDGFEQAVKLWQQERGLLHFMLDREELLGIDAEFAAAGAALGAGDLSGFSESCARVLEQLGDLFSSELPILENVF